jgi:hypothetical protein
MSRTTRVCTWPICARPCSRVTWGFEFQRCGVQPTHRLLGRWPPCVKRHDAEKVAHWVNNSMLGRVLTVVLHSGFGQTELFLSCKGNTVAATTAIRNEFSHLLQLLLLLLTFFSFLFSVGGVLRVMQGFQNGGPPNVVPHSELTWWPNERYI